MTQKHDLIVTDLWNESQLECHMGLMMVGDNQPENRWKGYHNADTGARYQSHLDFL
ncbi:MAG: hypothetical protein JRN67_06450 [Nitrososphaerota archaeon]|nr:hypothetical protein [Nitrososphaerota archaeon]